MKMNCENASMQKVYETGFAIDDAALFLNTHPDDPNAIEFYRRARQANRDAVRAYEAVYGPLFINDVEADCWNWISSPWPWEGGQR